MDMKKKKRRAVGIVLMWVGGVLTVITLALVLGLSLLPSWIGYETRKEEEAIRQGYLEDGCQEFLAKSWGDEIEEYQPGKDLHIYVESEFYDSYDPGDHEYLGILIDAGEHPDIDINHETNETCIFYKKSHTEVVTLPEDLAKRQISATTEITIVNAEDIEGQVFHRYEQQPLSLVSWAMTAFSFVYLIPLVIFIAGLIVFVANKEKVNAQI